MLWSAGWWLREAGWGRVFCRAVLEQLRDSLRRPYNVEMFKRLGKIVARQGRNVPAEDAVQCRTGAVSRVRLERVTGYAGAKDLRARIAGIGGERILGTADRDCADRRAGFGIPTADHVVATAGKQRAAVGKECDRPDRRARPDQSARERARFPIDDRDRTAGARRRNALATA